MKVKTGIQAGSQNSRGVNSNKSSATFVTYYGVTILVKA